MRGVSAQQETSRRAKDVSANVPFRRQRNTRNKKKKNAVCPLSPNMLWEAFAPSKKSSSDRRKNAPQCSAQTTMTTRRQGGVVVGPLSAAETKCTVAVDCHPKIRHSSSQRCLYACRTQPVSTVKNRLACPSATKSGKNIIDVRPVGPQPNNGN